MNGASKPRKGETRSRTIEKPGESTDMGVKLRSSMNLNKIREGFLPGLEEKGMLKRQGREGELRPGRTVL